MLSAIILARSLSHADFAAYSYFQMTSTLIASCAVMGLGVTASRFFAELGGGGDNDPPIGALWCVSILLSFAAFGAVYLIPNGWLTTGLDISQPLISLCVFILVLGVVPSGAILGLEKYRQATVVSMISGTIALSLSGVAAWAGNPKISMVGIVVAGAVQAFGESFVVIKVLGFGRIKKKLNFNLSDLEIVFNFAGPMVVVSLMSISGFWLLGRMILNGDNGSHSFSLYAIGLQWFSLAMFLPGIISRVILPRLVRSKIDEVDSRRFVSHACILAVGISLLIMVMGLFSGAALSGIYGSSYSFDRWFIAAYLIAAMVGAPVNVLGNAIIANNGQKIWFLLTVIWFVVLIGSANLFVGLNAWVGAMALTSAYAVLVSMAVIYARKAGLI